MIWINVTYTFSNMYYGLMTKINAEIKIEDTNRTIPMQICLDELLVNNDKLLDSKTDAFIKAFSEGNRDRIDSDVLFGINILSIQKDYSRKSDENEFKILRCESKPYKSEWDF